MHKHAILQLSGLTEFFAERYGLMGENKRYAAVYRFLRAVLSPLFALRYNYHTRPLPLLPKPCIVIANHAMDLDFMLLGYSFPQPMTFVIGETLFQNKLLRRFLVFIHDPVIISKAGTDGAAVLEILRRLRKGQNICLFAEGNTSFDGVTGPIPKGTAALVRASRASLVTFRLEGGYLTHPRWAYSTRRGVCRGEVARLYPPDELRAMGDEALNAAIARDIHVDACLDQLRRPVAYNGRQRARGLEHALYLCPSCKAIDTLQGSGQHIHCQSCGFSARFTPFGSFDKPSPYANIKQWVRAQKEYLGQMFETDASAMLRDEGQTLWQIQPDHSLRQITRGCFTMGQNGLSIGEYHLELPDIAGMAIFRRNLLMFTDKQGVHYQLDALPGLNALKYRDLYQTLNHKE